MIIKYILILMCTGDISLEYKKNKNNSKKRKYIKKQKKQRIFEFNEDIVISKIVGSSKVDINAIQFKFESKNAEKYLNSNLYVNLEVK
ncbi:MAG: hypothetical protein ACRDAQ_00295 [Cetobacterium sp.]